MIAPILDVADARALPLADATVDLTVTSHAALAVGWLHKATIVWDEGTTTKGNRALGSRDSSARPHPVDSWEMIVFLTKGEWGPSSSNPDDITPAEWQAYGRAPWRFPGAPRRKGGHPAPFPDELPYRCIRLLSRVGDAVLDPMMGSGTAPRVAQRLGRRAIGYDIAPAYVDAVRRALGVAEGRAA